MISPEQRWWSVRAGEYVLGTLRGEDLYLFEKILAHDTEIQAEVARWEQALVSLNDVTPHRSPSVNVLPGILARIREHKSAQEENRGGVNDSAPVSGQREAVLPLTPRSNSVSKLWPAIAGLATAASLVLAVLLIQGAFKPSPGINVDGLAVVLSDEGRVPYYLVETDYENGQIRVTALSPPSLQETQDLQLWQALPDRSSVRPVVLLPEETGVTMTLDVDTLIVGSDLFGVSIEPVGASTQAGPTGPVVAHGDYLNTRAAN